MMSDLDWMFSDSAGEADNGLDWMFQDPTPPEGNTPQIDSIHQLDSARLLTVKGRKREYRAALAKEALTRIVPELPPPDTDLWIIGNGSGSEINNGRINPDAFSFGDFIPHLVSMLGDRDITLYVSTWSMALPHALKILNLLDTGQVGRCAVLTDQYFRRREQAICNQLLTGLLSRGQRFATFKNHCKILALSNPAGNTAVIMGSSNLSAQPRAENWTLSTAPDLYEWVVREFFEYMFAHQEKVTYGHGDTEET